MKELSELLDKLKGSFLAVAGGLYVLGLLQWMVYSFRTHLGHVEAFQTQYFISGVVPGLVILYFYWLLKLLKPQSLKVSHWLNRYKYFKLALIYGIGIIIFATFILHFTMPAFDRWISFYLNKLPLWGWMIGIFLFLNIYLFFAPILDFAESKGKASVAFSNFFTNYYMRFTTILFVIGFLIYYSSEMYPTLPQELGGVKPKSAIFIAQPSDFSIPDRQLIFQDTATARILPSDTLDIYYYNDTKLIFKQHKEVKRLGSNAKTFEIGRLSIKSIKWLD